MRQAFSVQLVTVAPVPVTLELVGVDDHHFTRVGRKDIMDVEGTTGCLDGDPCVAVYVGFDELRPPVTITGEPEMPSLVVGPFLPHVAVYVGFVQVKPYVAAHLLSLLLLSVMVSAEPGGIQRLSQAVSRCRHLCGPPALGRAHVGDPREGADQTIVRASKPMTHIGTPSAPRSSPSAHGMWAITLPPTFYCPTDRRPSLPAMRYSAGLHFHHANNSYGAVPELRKSVRVSIESERCAVTAHAVHRVGRRRLEKQGREAGLPNVLCRRKSPQEGASRHGPTSQPTRLFPAGTGDRPDWVYGPSVCRADGLGAGADRRLAEQPTRQPAFPHAGQGASHFADPLWGRHHFSPSTLCGPRDGQDSVPAG